ncbi:MAG: DUF853 family protein [Gammaproteobacteria bacterium]|nr:DUF853 family protein [Gammaproteobacteria bacterium]
MEVMLMLEDAVAFPVTLIEGKPVYTGRIGSYVVVRQPGVRVVAMVVEARQEEKSVGVKLGLKATETVRRSVNRGFLIIMPLGELDESGHFHRGIVNYPTPGAAVHAVLANEVGALFEKHRDKGYRLGYLPTLPSVEICLDPSMLFGRHLAILGQSGSGKSWSVASLLQRAVETMPNAHIILLDLHGEYVWTDHEGKRHSAFTEDIYRAVDARDLEIPYWLLTYAELVDLLIDRTDQSVATQVALLREVLLNLRRKSNRNMPGVTISIDSPVYFSLQELFQQFKIANEQVTNFGKVKGPLYGQFDEFLIKLQARFNDVRYDFLFKPKRRKSSDSLEDLLRDFVGLRKPKRQITVIDFSTVPFDVRPTVSAQVGRLAFEFNYWNPRSREFPILLMCEEAHSYIPRDSGTQYEGTRRSMERIAKEGRKYGIGLAVVSQRPHELSETVLAQCGNFICLRVTNPDDQKYIRDLVPDAEAGLMNTLSSLGRGEAMAMGEAVPIPTRFQFYPPDPPPNSTDVDFYGHWVKGLDELDVNAIVDSWRRQRRGG